MEWADRGWAGARGKAGAVRAGETGVTVVEAAGAAAPVGHLPRQIATRGRSPWGGVRVAAAAAAVSAAAVSAAAVSAAAGQEATAEVAAAEVAAAGGRGCWVSWAATGHPLL